MTSCHCSFSLSYSKHHACNSFSSSCTSSLMSPLSSSTAFRLLLQLPLAQCAAMCPVSPQFQQTLMSPLPPFSCPFPPFFPPILDHCPFPARFAPFSPFPLLKCFCTLQLGPFPPLHQPVAPVPLSPACTASSDAFPYPSSNACSCCHADLHWCTRVNFHLRCRMRRDLVYEEVLQRDEQFSTWQCGATDTIVQQTQASFFHCQDLLLV